MKAFLKANGIEAMPKFIWTGSLKGSWRLYDAKQAWAPALWDKLNALGFTDLWGKPLGPHIGNGGMFSVFVRGHRELLNDRVQTPSAK